jgi:hypothetical protein
MDYSAEAWSAGYGLSFMPTFGTSSTGVFFPRLMGGGLVFGLISARVWEFLFLLSFFDSFGRVHRGMQRSGVGIQGSCIILM